MEKIQADIVNNSTDKELLCESIVNDIEMTMNDICYTSNIDIEQLKDGNEKQYKNFCFICRQIGKSLFKGTNKLKDTTKNINGFYNTYDIELLDLLCEFYIDLCDRYNKSVNLANFCALVGLSRTYFNNRRTIDEILNARHLNLIQKITTYKEESESESFINSTNGVKQIAYMNHKYNWSDNNKQSQNITLSISSDGLKQSLLELKKD